MRKLGISRRRQTADGIMIRLVGCLVLLLATGAGGCNAGGGGATAGRPPTTPCGPAGAATRADEQRAVRVLVDEGNGQLAEEFLALPRPLVSGYQYVPSQAPERGAMTLPRPAFYRLELGDQAVAFLRRYPRMQVIRALNRFLDDPLYQPDACALLARALGDEPMCASALRASGYRTPGDRGNWDTAERDGFTVRWLRDIMRKELGVGTGATLPARDGSK